MAKFHKKVIVGYDVVGSGIKKVTYSGTPETLNTSTSVRIVLIKALSTNTEIVVIGGSNVSATPTSTPIGIPLVGTPVGNASILEIGIDDLSKIYVAVAKNGEGVSYVYYK